MPCFKVKSCCGEEGPISRHAEALRGRNQEILKNKDKKNVTKHTYRSPEDMSVRFPLYILGSWNILDASG